MKKKILSILISVLAICTFMFTLSACGGGEPPHTHTFNKEVATSDYLSTNATCDKEAEYFYSCECGVKGTETFKKGSALGHAYGDWISNGNNTHSKICSNNNTHIITEDCSGGTPTETQRPVCKDCHTEYGETLAHNHNHNILEHNETEHWYECSCGDKIGIENHKGGTATETDKAVCSVCNQQYGESLGHVHTLHLTKVDAKPQSCTKEGNIEYYTCSCGKWFTADTAITEITDKASVVIAKDSHNHNILKHNETEHWYECSCGDRATAENHKGGTATETDKAVCSVCNQQYGESLGHVHTLHLTKVDAKPQSCTKEGNIEYYTCSCGKWFTADTAITEITDKASVVIAKDSHNHNILKYNETEHWYECSCGDKATAENHKGGTATETQRPVCSVCNQQYGESLGHVHTLHLTKVDAKPQSCTEEGNIEYYTCSCGKWFTDNTATTEITDKTSVVIAKDSHNHNILKHNETEHWYECSCGDRATAEEHKGGTATCQVKATCSVCGEKYGTLGSHQPKTEWVTTETHHYHECKTSGCTEKLNYGEHNFDSNKKCGGCDYVTTALLGTEISSNVYEISGTNLFVKVPNTQTNFSFAKTINVAKGATYKVYTDISCKEEYCIPSYVVNDLKEENNVYYFLVSNGDEIPQVYTVTVRRRPKYTVTFNTDGGSYVAPQTIEEDALAAAPTTTKTGYSFDSWDYDFNTAITGNKTIKASWSINQYTITFVLNNGKENVVIKQNYNTSITAPVPTKIGHTFTTWDKSVPSVMPAENMTITANWKINQYSITIVYGNGQGNKIITQDYNSDVEEIDIPERLGYTFDGWDKEIPVKMPAEDVIITANWKESTKTPYKVEYCFENIENDDYTILDSETENLTGTTNSTVYADIKTFEHFTAEKTSVSGVVSANGTTVLKVYYQRDEYTVTFDGNGGTLISGEEVQTVKYGGSVSAPTYEKEGYTLTEFDKSLANIKESYTTIANWRINQYTITIVYGNGQEDKIITQEYNTIITETLPTIVEERQGYTFNGWDSEMPNIMPSQNSTINASWLAIFIISNNQITGLTTHGKTLNQIAIPEKIDGVSVTSIGDSAFYNFYKLTSVEIGDRVTSIGEKAFAYCECLTNIKMPNSLEYIGDKAFYGCDSLISVDIPNSVEDIGENAFGSCNALSEINISNSYYMSIDGVLYHKMRKALVQYPAGKQEKSFVLPNNITSISGYAFKDCNVLTHIEIQSQNDFWIDEGAFSGCSSVQSMTLPFVGATERRTGEKNQYPFGYIFGSDSYSGGTTIEQRFYGNVYNEITKKMYCIPDTLTSVKITGGNILYGAFYNCSNLIEIEIPKDINVIYDRAFFGCQSLTSVVIPNSVTSIGDYAFYGADCITSVEYKGSIDGWVEIEFGNEYSNPLKYAKKLIIDGKEVTEVNITTATKINNYAFYYCDSLTSIEIPNSVTSIGDSAFEYCYSLTSVIIGNSVTSIGDSAFAYCTSLTSIEIPDSVTSIGEKAFYGCTSLTNVIIPNSVEVIGSNAFSDCPIRTANIPALAISSIPQNVLKEVVITGGESIEEQAFYNCSLLTNVKILEGIINIGNSAFYGCSQLQSVEVPNSLQQIGVNVFYKCESLVGNIKDDLQYLGNDENLYICLIKAIRSDLKEANIENGCKFILASAFYNCSSLTNVKIPDSVIDIGQSAFSGCVSLVSIYIPEGVIDIKYNTFRGCSSLRRVIMPRSIVVFGDYSFYGCAALKTVYYKGDKESWKLISEGKLNAPVLNAIRYYYIENQEDVPTDGGNYWHYDENGNPIIW